MVSGGTSHTCVAHDRKYIKNTKRMRLIGAKAGAKKNPILKYHFTNKHKNHHARKPDSFTSCWTVYKRFDRSNNDYTHTALVPTRMTSIRKRRRVQLKSIVVQRTTEYDFHFFAQNNDLSASIFFAALEPTNKRCRYKKSS